MRFMVLRALLMLVLFTGLGVFTLLMAFFVMFLQWHWQPGLILAVCLSPWLVLAVVLAILTCMSLARLKAKKRNWISFENIDRESLLFQAISFGMMLVRRRK